MPVHIGIRQSGIHERQAQMQKITPFLMFVGKQHGKAEEAIHFYVSLFRNSKIVSIERYGPGEGETTEP
jgi:predicted 3-demethylubiquinone-9 3-methyltransferase (glyoxalase superfamily)